MNERCHFVLNSPGLDQAGHVKRRRGGIRGRGKAETGSTKRGMRSLSAFLFLVP